MDTGSDPSKLYELDGVESPDIQMAFTRYCYCQYCMGYGIHKGVRGGVVYGAIVVQ